MTSLIAEALHDDPFHRWLLPNHRLRTSKLRRALELDVRHRLNGVSIPFVVRHAGIAFWRPPGAVQPPRSVSARVARTYVRMTGQHPILSRRIAHQELVRRPSAPHWHLDLLAVDPGHRRDGIGRMLMDAGLERADADGVGAHATTRDPGSGPFFESLGFAEVGRVDVPGAPVVSMLWRPPFPSDLERQPAPTEAETESTPYPSCGERSRHAHHVDR
jgi:hypothetical protein